LAVVARYLDDAKRDQHSGWLSMLLVAARWKRGDEFSLRGLRQFRVDWVEYAALPGLNAAAAFAHTESQYVRRSDRPALMPDATEQTSNAIAHALSRIPAELPG